jgi:hypothetical protein
MGKSTLDAAGFTIIITPLQGFSMPESVKISLHIVPRVSKEDATRIENDWLNISIQRGSWGLCS